MQILIHDEVPPAFREQFEEQAARLYKLGLIGYDDMGDLYPLLKLVPKNSGENGQIPFLIVPQNPNLTLLQRMMRISLNDKTGTTDIRDALLKNTTELPGCYLAVGVDIGFDMRGKKPSVCLREFAEKCRFGALAIEGITLATLLPELLESHSMDLPGSTYDQKGVVCLEENIKDGPTLFMHHGCDEDEKIGSASCEMRICMDNGTIQIFILGRGKLIDLMAHTHRFPEQLALSC